MNRSTWYSKENAIKLESIDLTQKFLETPQDSESKRKQSKSTQDHLCSVCHCMPPGSTVQLKVPGNSAKESETVLKPAVNPLVMRRITIAGGFLDIALFSANCEQLKFVLELGTLHIYYNEVLGLIITSLVLQLVVGFTLLLMGCHVVKKTSDESFSNFLNHATMGLVALITVINIFISTFGPKGTVMARCLGAFSYPHMSGPVWTSYLNFTRHYMSTGL